MKYNDKNKPLVCMQTTSLCYIATYKQVPKGVLWHSTGANNPYISRYVQPSDNAPDRDKMLALLGVNKNHNDWNHVERTAGLNCWIGKLTDGTVTTVQSMPWDYRPWGCGAGKKGSCNTGWIQFEICEDSLNDKSYFDKVYKEACEITAYICRMYNIDPMGTVTVSGVKIPTILCHWDSYELGFGSGHNDVYHWFNKYGKTMDNVRQDVKALMTEKPTEEVKTKMLRSISEYAPYTQDTLKKLVDGGAIGGTGTGKKDADGRPADLNLTDEQAQTFAVIDRAHKLGIW